MEQQDSKGTENPPEMPASPQSSEKDKSKEDTIPPEESSKVEPEGDGSSQPEPEGSSQPELTDKITPRSLKAKSKILKKSKANKVNSKKDTITPEESSKPELEGLSKPEPDGCSQPEPQGSSQPELSDKNTPQSLRAKSKILKKFKAVKVNSKKDTIPPQGSSKPEPEGSSKQEPEGSSEPEPQGSSQPEPSDKNTPQSLRAKSKILKKSKAVKANSKKDTIPPEGSSKLEPEGSGKPETEGSSKPEPDGSSQPEPNDKNTPQSLRAKSKILKKTKAVIVKTNGCQQIHGEKRKRRNRKVVGNTDEPPKGKSLEAEKSEEKESQNKSTSDKFPSERRHQAEKNKIIQLGKSEQKQKYKEKHRESDKGARSRTNKAKHRGVENAASSEKKREKLGGFIFMCSGKTKPDCFRYRVMGVPAGKKDVVLGVKPGMNLFLYDFDLKLLYGIYKASSSGGMKLEPRAFGGNFPAQVRFSIACDCFPLPESIFRKAIKENYNEKNKFKTELTVRQVRKLTQLFRPVEIRSALQPARSPPKSLIRDEEDLDGGRASWSHLHGERGAGDPYTNGNVNSYNVLSHERDPRFDCREEIPCDLFLTEKSYRAYGLQGDRRNVTSASQVNPILEPPYKRDYEREQLHHLDPLYRENVPSRVESLRADPRYLNESEHKTYLRGAISDRTDDLYHPYRYGASPRDPYLPPLSREDIPLSSYAVGGRTLIGTDNLQRRETVHDRHYSTYSAADALSEHDRMQHYHREKLDATAASVSSRYSFAGPSYSLR